jgi:hypothetical protein
MIAYDKLGKVTITKTSGQYVAKGAGCIGYGNSPREALIDWRKANKTLDRLAAS